MGTEGKMCDPVINWWEALQDNENYFDTIEYKNKLDAWCNGNPDSDIDHEFLYDEFCSKQFNLVF